MAKKKRVIVTDRTVFKDDSVSPLERKFKEQAKNRYKQFNRRGGYIRRRRKRGQIL